MRARGALLAIAAALLGARATAQDVAVRGGVVHTMAGAPIEDGVVVVQGGRITAVGPAAEVEVPEGLRVLEAAVVVPGLVDAHSTVGLAGWLNTPHDRDELDRSAAVQPELRAIDAYNAREPLIEWVRGFGVTTVHTGHAPGALVSGQTLVAKTSGDTVEEAVVVSEAMVACTLGEDATRQGKEVPGTRSKAVAVLRAELVKAGEYREKVRRAEEGGDGESDEEGEEKRPPDRDLRLETLARVLDGELPLLVTAHRARDIATALRLREEFDLTMVLDGCAEAYLLLDRIRAAGVPVIVHPTMQRASGETENLSMETAAALVEAGIPTALQSGYESYVPRTRVVLFEAAVAAAYGLSFEQALGLVTIDAARLLGLEEQIGSLEVEKDGDLALYDGDPFEYTTRCVGVVIEGEVVSEEPR